jgi:hypothetical protein
MTFNELWPTLAIPGEYDSMDGADQTRWRNVIRQAFKEGVMEEREACARIADQYVKTSLITMAEQIAAAIRARGEG